MLNRKFLKIGHQIINGPRFIYPPTNGNDWMEKDVSVYVRYLPDTRIQHISLWSDSTMNKEQGFLKPVIRFVDWEKQNDLKKTLNKEAVNWPDVRVFLGYIKDDKFEQLNNALIKIQQLIPVMPFYPLGISLNRDVVTIEKADFSTDYEIWIRNGVQNISYYSPAIEGDAFSNAAISLKNLMLESMEQFDPAGWREKYNSPFDADYYEWDYKEANGAGK